MKHFAIATLLIGSVLIVADLLAEETIPWHWDAEDTVYIEQQQPVEISRQQQADSVGFSDLGW